MEKLKPVVLIGYSGHAFVLCDIFNLNNHPILGYCDYEKKEDNPFNLNYLGKETEARTISIIEKNTFFIGIGNNKIRRNIYQKLSVNTSIMVNAIHPSSVISQSVNLMGGIMVAANVSINPLAKIGRGVICNTGSIIEHECKIGDFTHIGPGAVLAGNVKVGETTFVGANAVIKQGITIGNNVTVGAGAVVVRDIPDNTVVVGNPAKPLIKQ